VAELLFCVFVFVVLESSRDDMTAVFN